MAFMWHELLQYGSKSKNVPVLGDGTTTLLQLRTVFDTAEVAYKYLREYPKKAGEVPRAVPPKYPRRYRVEYP